MLACVVLRNVCAALRHTAITMPVIGLYPSLYVPRNRRTVDCSTVRGPTTHDKSGEPCASRSSPC